MKITLEDIKQLIQEADVMVGDIESLKDDISLVSQGIDSLDMANIYLLTEEKFGVIIPDEKIGELQTINDILNFVNSSV